LLELSGGVDEYLRLLVARGGRADIERMLRGDEQAGLRADRGRSDADCPHTLVGAYLIDVNGPRSGDEIDAMKFGVVEEVVRAAIGGQIGKLLA
jgi:hypothetical protein